MDVLSIFALIAGNMYSKVLAAMLESAVAAGNAMQIHGQ